MTSDFLFDFADDRPRQIVCLVFSVQPQLEEKPPFPEVSIEKREQAVYMGPQYS